MTLRHISLLFVFVLWWTNAFSTTYYVDATGGSDSNNGIASTTAWQTVAKVNSVILSPGDNVLFKKGEVWRERLVPSASGTTENPIIFSSYGTGSNPVISGADVLSGWTQAGSDWYASLSAAPSQVFEDTNRLTAAASLAAMVPGSWWYDSANTRVYVRMTAGDNPAGHAVEATMRGSAVYSAFRNHLIFRGLSFDSATEGALIEAGAKNLEFDAITAAHSRNRGIVMLGGTLGGWSVSASSVVSAVADFSGGSDAYSVVANSTNATHGVYYSGYAPLFSANNTYTVSVWAKQGMVEWNRVQVLFRTSNFTTLATCRADVNVPTGSIGTTSGAVAGYSSSTLSNGFRRVGVSCVAPDNADLTRTTVYLYPLAADNTLAFAGNGVTTSMTYYGFQVSAGSSPEPHQYGDYPENIEIHDSLFNHNGIDTAGGDIAAGSLVTGVHVHNNTMYGSESAALGIDGVVFTQASSGHLIENNVIYNHLEDGIDLKGVRRKTLTSGTYTTVRNNTVYGHTVQTGITVQLGSQNILVYGNTVYGNLTGIWVREYSTDGLYEDTKNVSIHHNVVRDNLASGISASQYFSSGLAITNNTVIRNGGAGAGASYTGIAVSAGTGIVSRNNILSKNRPDAAAGLYKVQAYLPVTTGSIDFDNDLYYWPDASSIIYHDSSNLTVSAFQSAYSQELSAVLQDPLFTNFDVADLSLQSTSPAIDAGTHVAGVTTGCSGTCTDFLGNPIYGLPDIGAIEYQPPYVMGRDDIVKASVRVYGDGKYTSTGTTVAGAKLSIIPVSGTTAQYVDVTVAEWTPVSKRWDEVASAFTANVVRTVCGLSPSTLYASNFAGVSSSVMAGANGCYSWTAPATNASYSLSLALAAATGLTVTLESGCKIQWSPATASIDGYQYEINGAKKKVAKQVTEVPCNKAGAVDGENRVRVRNFYRDTYSPWTEMVEFDYEQ